MICMNFRVIQGVIKLFRREADRRTEGNSNEAYRFYLHGIPGLQ